MSAVCTPATEVEGGGEEGVVEEDRGTGEL